MAAKIQLSEEELKLVQNAEWLLTKNNIISKVYHLFGEIAEWQQRHISSVIFPSSPKISKGENYQGLPYVMLDHPRVFGKEDVFAVRTMFWWGHYFSVTLHLKGIYKEKYRQLIIENRLLLEQHDFYICIGEDEWRHEFAEDNYVLLSQVNADELETRLLATDFCKLSAKISLHQWDRSKEILCALYEMIFTSLGH
jgi:hypothetical protein